LQFHKKTIKDINIQGKTVLVRADFNVPLDSKGGISDAYRIKMFLPTLRYLLNKNCKVVICSHLGRPEGRRNIKYTMAPVAQFLQKNIDNKVFFVPDCIGETTRKAVEALEKGQVAVLENLRFYAQEEQNNQQFAKELSMLGDVLVQDAFGVVHRAHASTDAITKYIPSVAGLLLEREVSTINDIMDNPKRPLMTIVGGAKIADKIKILERFIEIADVVIVGGAMANTFLQAKGHDIGSSISDQDDIPLAKQIIKKAKEEAKKRRFVFYLPSDSVVAQKIDKLSPTRIVDWDAHVISSIENYPKKPPINSGKITKDELILDIGPYSGAFISGCMQMVDTVVWNGVMGVTETAGTQGPVGPYAHGTEVILESLMGEFGHKPYSMIGGGDTAAYIEKRGLSECFNHVSTGGGASLDLLAGKKLPGVEALIAK
jgi:phosphoglycerate kinase